MLYFILTNRCYYCLFYWFLMETNIVHILFYYILANRCYCCLFYWFLLETNYCFMLYFISFNQQILLMFILLVLIGNQLLFISLLNFMMLCYPNWLRDRCHCFCIIILIKWLMLLSPDQMLLIIYWLTFYIVMYLFYTLNIIFYFFLFLYFHYFILTNRCYCCLLY